MHPINVLNDGENAMASRRMQQRMRLLKTAGALGPQDGQPTSRYGDLIRQAGGAVLELAPERYRAGLQERYGVIYLAERAPYGTHGYALYRTGAGGFTEFLCAGSPFHGHQIPLTWAEGEEARRVATLLGCRVTYACRGDGVSAVDYLREHKVGRLGNKGVPVTVAELGDLVAA
ncbi:MULTISPECIES: hypothetical protein [Cupriavidus]